MKKEYLLGIDIGTSQSKGVLTDLRGAVAASAAVSHDTLPVGPGCYEHDPEEIWVKDCRELIRQLKQESGAAAEEIAAVSLSAIGPCVLPVDRSGQPLCSAILYGIDTRAGQEIQEWNRRYGEDFFVDRCGNTLSSQAAGPKIVWLKRHRPEAFQEAACFMTSTSYLVYRLTGETVMDYYTACAGYTPLFRYRDLDWDREMCREAGCEGRLPQLRWTAERAGRITRAAAEEFGLAEGTPVCTGTCDAAAEAVSVGVIQPGQTMLMLGSTAFLISLTEKPAADRRLWAAPYLFPGTYCILGGMGSAGSLTKWFLSELAEETACRAKESGENVYDLLARMAETAAPLCEGLLALPYFCGERTPLNDPQARGVFFGLDLHHTKAHLYRALLESVAYGIRDNLEAMREAGCEVNTLQTVGGGALNRLWVQIISDVSGCRQNISQVGMGAAYGDAFLAGLGSGRITGREEIRSWVQQKGQIVPDPTLQSSYDDGFRRFKALYRALSPLMHEEGERAGS